MLIQANAVHVPAKRQSCGEMYVYSIVEMVHVTLHDEKNEKLGYANSQTRPYADLSSSFPFEMRVAK